MDPATQGAPNYFVWEVPDEPVVVQLKLDVVDRMSAEILRGFGAVPKRGAEVGGILLGSIQPGDVSTIRIEDFEAVPCRYARGPSFLLTEPERAIFDQACRRWSPESGGPTYSVGYFRSHTRDGLSLQPEDLELLDKHFFSPAPIALLVKPFATKPGIAGFFIRKDGSFPSATPMEFPFRRWEMTGEEPPRRASLHERKRKEREPEPAAAPRPRPEGSAAPPGPAPYYRIFSAEPNEPPQEQPKAPEGQASPKSRTGLWLVAAFVFLLLGVLLGFQASRITAPRRSSDFALSLAVEPNGQNLMVRWNPESPAVRSASHGTLEIDEGGENKRLELDRANLSNGRMVYHSASDQVRFRLVVDLSPELSVSEALDWSR